MHAASHVESNCINSRWVLPVLVTSMHAMLSRKQSAGMQLKLNVLGLHLRRVQLRLRCGKNVVEAMTWHFF